jgi:hypothetical protein
MRRGYVYGTVLVDILAHRPVDLVEERTSTAPDRTPGLAPAAPAKATPRRVTRWIMTNPANLADGDQVRLKQILARCPELEPACTATGLQSSTG